MKDKKLKPNANVVGTDSISARNKYTPRNIFKIKRNLIVYIKYINS